MLRYSIRHCQRRVHINNLNNTYTMSVLKRTETVVALVLLLIAAAVLVTVFVVNNDETVTVEGTNPTTEETSAGEQPDEPGAPNEEDVTQT